jgi:putative FmdB family regulatory protein
MPIYEYECQQHGVFDELRSFDEYQLPANCPVCENACARAVSMPRFRMMSDGKFKAHERNEKSQHEPAAHKGKLADHALFKGKAKRGHYCTSSCDHQKNTSADSTSPEKSQTFQSYLGPRPWVVEHVQGTTIR